jgi:hypothetical protein
MLVTLIALGLAVFHSSQGASSSVFFGVPAALEQVEGNDSLIQPLFTMPGHLPSRVGIHFQQVIAAAEFGRLPPGGAWLTRLFIRPDCGSSGETFVTNLQIRLSTTQRPPDGLSPVFAENVGPDEALVYRAPGTRELVRGQGTGCPANISETEILISGQFHYDPARGNLLVDIRRGGLAPFVPPGGTLNLRHDAETRPGDGISHLLSYTPGAATAETVSTAGVIFYFQFDYDHRLSISRTTNLVEVLFPGLPRGARLQIASAVGAEILWQDYPGSTEYFGFTRRARIPLSQLQTQSYFRFLIPPATP